MNMMDSMIYLPIRKGSGGRGSITRVIKPNPRTMSQCPRAMKAGMRSW